MSESIPRPSLPKRVGRAIRSTYRQAVAPGLIRRFNRLYYFGLDDVPLFQTTTWLGVPALKCPMDAWMYQEILTRTRPEVILETGVMLGGSTLMLASFCDLIGTGSIMAVDIDTSRVDPKTTSHPRVTILQGSSTAPEVVRRMADFCAGKRTMVILDSDHRQFHVAEELRLYSPFVSVGCYLIVEDTNVNGHPVHPKHGPGPYEAVEDWLKGVRGWKVDRAQERLMVTFNPNGYLLREA